MIKFEKKDVTTVERGIVAHGVNCQKRMRSGVAKGIRAKWPEVYERFMVTSPQLGSICPVRIEDELIVVNCYTQMFYGRDGQRYANLKAISECFASLVNLSTAEDLDIYMPKIGCGLGGLKWDEEVYPELKRVSEFMGGFNDIIVCEL